MISKFFLLIPAGTVIVGSVDGNRVWAREFSRVPIAGVQWSPDGQLLLMSTLTGEIHIYDSNGSFMVILVGFLSLFLRRLGGRPLAIVN